jgi:hypothetical protein
MITLVFRADIEAGIVHMAMIAFGGRNWLEDAAARGGSGGGFPGRGRPIRSSIDRQGAGVPRVLPGCSASLGCLPSVG